LKNKTNDLKHITLQIYAYSDEMIGFYFNENYKILIFVKIWKRKVNVDAT